VIRLTSSAICGSDLHVYHGIAGSTNAHYTLGHEGVGIVQEVGEAVQLVKKGDRVIVPCIGGVGKLEEQPVPAVNVYGFGPDSTGTTDGMQGLYFF
jgi:threonine dehydrogenase-like Zn-dependent dehydrogenase